AAGTSRASVGYGERPVFPHAATVDLLIWIHGDEVRIAAPSAVGLTLEPSVDRGRQIGVADPGAQAWQSVGDRNVAQVAFLRAVVGSSAQLLGLSATMLDMTVEYVKTRKQFGVPVGSFQAIKHHLADALGALEFARPMVWRAAWTLDHDGAEAEVAASSALHFAGEAANTISKIALQCHGAIGYTTEYDLHLYMKRAWALSRAFGDPASHRRRLAELVLDGPQHMYTGGL
ncbi:MAG: acyl-CoA dehydrogenase, partial [Candidatus Dadabacteria bacterium]